LMQADVHESAEFAFLGTTVKLSKAGNGALSATVGEGLAKTTVKLGFDAVALVRRLVGRSVEAQGAIGGAVKEMLNAAYALDVKNGLMSSDRTSLTSNFAALLLEARGRTDLAQGELFNLAEGNYNTGLLVQIAQRSLDGTLGEGNVLDTKQKLDNYYGQMRKDTANLPDDIKQLLEGVANMPFELAGDGGFIVRNADAGHDGAARSGAEKSVTALARLRIAFAAAGDDAAKKAAAIRAFAIGFADAQGRVLHAMRQNLTDTANVRESEPPSTFASGITDILFDNFRVVSSALGGDSGTIVSDARRIAVDKLHADISENAFTLFAIPTIVNAIQEDAERAGDDNSYKIDIGI
ncbi:MAG: hypothetical protein IJL06_08785, partial [Kiritimatiellae bacterium]|nr:hypothetical protein [Kiritimatiellia bacterium]